MQKEMSKEKQRFLKSFEKYCDQSLSDNLKIIQGLKEERQKHQHDLKYILLFLFITIGLSCYLANVFYDGTLTNRLNIILSVAFIVIFVLLFMVVYMCFKMHITSVKMNHHFIDFIMSYFTEFKDLKEQGGFIVCRTLKQSELFGNQIEFSSEDCFVAEINTKRVLLTEARVNFQDYLIMVIEMENKYFRPTMARREGGVFKFVCCNGTIDVSFGENKSYIPIDKVSCEAIAQNKKLFYVPFWEAFEELKQSVFGTSVKMAFFEDKLVVAIREDTDLFEPSEFDMRLPTFEKLGDIAWQIQSVIKFADFYDEQRDVLLKYAQKNKLDYKEITSHRFV